MCAIAILCGATALKAPPGPPDLSAFDFVQSGSTLPNQSVPLGNGNLAANVWLDNHGTIQLYVSRSDAWNEVGSVQKVVAASVQLSQPTIDVSQTNVTHSIADGTVTITDGHLKIVVFADFDDDAVRVIATAPSTEVVGSITLEPIRSKETVNGASMQEWFGSSICNSSYPVRLDTVPDPASLPGVLGASGAAVWHRNSPWDPSGNTTVFVRTLTQQLIDPEPLRKHDVLSSRVAAAAVLATNGARD